MRLGFSFFARRPKAQIQIQLQWIFVGVAGIIILIFFFSLIFRQQAQAQTTDVRSFLDTFEIYLSGAAASSKTASVVTKPDYQLFFSARGVQVDEQFLSFESTPVFSPPIISEDETDMIFFSYPWEVPYYVVDFVYVTSPSNHYVFVLPDSPNGVQQRFYDRLFDVLLPDAISHDVVSLASLSDYDISQGTTTHFIGLDTSFTDLNSFPDEVEGNIEDGDAELYFFSSITLADTDPAPAGDVSFYTVNATASEPTLLEDHTRPFFATAGFFAAVFASSVSQYEGSMLVANEHLYALTKVLDVKRSLLHNAFSDQSRDRCSRYYDSNSDGLFLAIQLASASAKQNDTSLDSLLQLLPQEYGALSTKNYQLEAASCPLLY